jgi:hypothetical protein
MNAIIAILAASIPRAAMAIAAKVLTDAVLQDMLERIMIAGLRRAAKLTTTEIDDEAVEVVARAIRGEAPIPLQKDSQRGV